MDSSSRKNTNLYQIAVIFSELFAQMGFSYNVRRMEISEENNTIRTASIEMLLEMSSLEQLIYTAHYDGDVKEVSPRKGRVKAGLINDPGALTTDSVKAKSVFSRASGHSNGAGGAITRALLYRL